MGRAPRGRGSDIVAFLSQNGKRGSTGEKTGGDNGRRETGNYQGVISFDRVSAPCLQPSTGRSAGRLQKHRPPRGCRRRRVPGAVVLPSPSPGFPGASFARDQRERFMASPCTRTGQGGAKASLAPLSTRRGGRVPARKLARHGQRRGGGHLDAFLKSGKQGEPNALIRSFGKID